MNDERSLERGVASLYAGMAPSREPAFLLDDVLSTTGRARQRPRWLALIKEPPMRISSRLAVGSPAARLATTILTMILLATLATGAVFAGARFLAGPAVLVVDPDAPGAFQSISEAVAAAAEGDTILVRPGTYSESIVIDKSITLMGDGEREAVVITTPPEGPDAIVAPDDDDWRYTLLLQESDAMVSGLTFRGDWAGILVRGGSPTLAELHMDHVGSPYGSSLPGLGSSIDILDGSTATVRDSLFTVTQNITVFDDSSPTIEGNVLEGGTHIYLLDAGDDAVVRGNTISGTYRWAIFVNGPTTMLIEGNTISGSVGDGITIGYGRSLGVDPVIRGNTISGTNGINVTGSGARPVIEGNTIRGDGQGVIVTASDAIVTGNTIGGGVGAGLALLGGSPTASGNVVEGKSVGLLWYSDASPVLEGNTLCGNEDNVKHIILSREQPDPELPGNEVCPDGLMTADAGG